MAAERRTSPTQFRWNKGSRRTPLIARQAAPLARSRELILGHPSSPAHFRAPAADPGDRAGGKAQVTTPPAIFVRIPDPGDSRWIRHRLAAILALTDAITTNTLSVTAPRCPANHGNRRASTGAVSHTHRPTISCNAA